MPEKKDFVLTSPPTYLIRHVTQPRGEGGSSWLNAIPVEEQGMTNKEEVRNSLRIRYNLPLSDLLSSYVCRAAFPVNHALSCKRGGFVAQRHDGICDLLTTLLSRVCNNVEAEPKLIPLDNEQFNYCPPTEARMSD